MKERENQAERENQIQRHGKEKEEDKPKPFFKKGLHQDFGTLLAFRATCWQGEMTCFQTVGTDAA